jgi:hypothetical protein
MKKVITTKESYSKTRKPKAKKTGGMVTTGDLGKTKTDAEIIFENFDCISSETIKAVKAEIEDELKKRQPEYWKCDNCKFVIRLPWGRDGGNCVNCNMVNSERGGVYRKMSAAEVKKHLAEKAKEQEAIFLKMKKARFFRGNDLRKSRGEDPLTWDEFCKEEDKRRKKRK